MKTKLTQLFFYVNNIDRRYMQAAYFVFILAHWSKVCSARRISAFMM